MAVQTKYRLITYSQEIVDGQPIFVSSNCLPVKALKFEPAGHAYHSAALKLLGVLEDKEGEVDDKKVADEKEIIMAVYDGMAVESSGIFDIKWSPPGGHVSPCLAQADVDGYLTIQMLENEGEEGGLVPIFGFF
ncbi:hypothetical protein RIF29_29097 [Crotalaria pallida]|uniref:Uncharacterized protein n=1 Tax=Crotalaria pallida TaxID=3830 RepID=A0AAN9EG35_CROPI